MHIRAANLLDDPVVRGVLVNALDVTREREAMATARKSDERLRVSAYLEQIRFYATLLKGI